MKNLKHVNEVYTNICAYSINRDIEAFLVCHDVKLIENSL